MGKSPQTDTMEDPLESLADLIRPWHERRDQMRARAAQWIRSEAFRGVFYDDAHPPLAAQVLLGRELKGKDAKALRKNTEVFGLQTPELLKQYQDLADHGVLVFGRVIIVNPGCADQPNHNLPCLVLVPEDQSPLAVAKAAEVAEWLGEIYVGIITDEPALAKLLRDDEFQLFRRRTLPSHPMMRGENHLFDLAVRLTWMPPERLPFIPLLIHPGRNGPALQIPWSIVTDTPAVPGSMERGIWGEFAELDQEADRMVAEQKSRRGCRYYINLVAGSVFFFGLGTGLLQLIKEQIWPPEPVPATEVKAVQTPKNNVVWEQSPEVRRRTTPVPAEEYRPLQLPGNYGYGFAFALPNSMVLAASSRGDSTGPPKELLSEGKTHLTLDSDDFLTQRHSYIQLVTAIPTRAGTLAFHPDTILKPGEAMLILAPTGPPIPCTLDISQPHPLNSPAKKLKLKLDIAQLDNSGNLSGCPVVLTKTGRVAGVLIAPEGSASPTVRWFETLSLNAAE